MMAKSTTECSRSLVIRDEDFEEEDVWSYTKERGHSSSTVEKSKESSSSSSAWRLGGTQKMIPRATNPTNHEGKRAQQSSAPVNIPDWSKIYGKSASIGSARGRSWVGYGDDTSYDDDGDDDDDVMVPPHEWLARKFARNQISSFSVCEGIGRTLKGRDLSKVRNAVLTKTGFLE